MTLDDTAMNYLNKVLLMTNDDDGVMIIQRRTLRLLDDIGGIHMSVLRTYTIYIVDSVMKRWGCSRWFLCSTWWNSCRNLWWCSSPHWFDSRTYSQEQGACCYYATRWTDDGRTNDATTCSADASKPVQQMQQPVQEMPQQTTQQGYEFEQK